MTPKQIKLNKKEGNLFLHYELMGNFLLSGEYLRIHSPSAEVQGHGKGQGVLQYGKEFVKISSVESIGNYALRLTFSDNHNSGIFTWKYLYDLAINYNKYWSDYLEALSKSGKYRDPNIQSIQFI
ncbi:MAG: DUF971 domain-containing protein [Cellvibrionales bacterium]|nr:DUF971 domain-containing protein [Cellvibrionales bacterium]MDC0412087.1 DUF971 domain-containing protein [Porticoccus sp.]MDC1093781.1 DUF971 domain-containing protein [Porticoccus sp.]